MAKVSITIEIDTEEYSMDVTVNGKKVPNANYVSCYTYNDSYENEKKVSCNITSSNTDEEAGITTVTNYYTDSSKEAKNIAKSDAILNIPGFTGRKDIDPTKAISNFFSKDN